MSLSIRKNIYGLLMITLLLIALIEWHGIVGMDDINKELHSIHEDHSQPPQLIANENLAPIAWNRATLNHVLAESSEKMDEYERIMLDQRIAITERLEELSKMMNLLSKKGKKLVRELQKGFQQADPIRDCVVALSRAGKKDEARELIRAELSLIIDQMDKDMTEFLLLQEKQLVEAKKITDIRYEQSVIRSFIIIASVLVLTSLAVFFVSNSILKDIKELVRGTKLVAEGHFQKAKVNIRSNDELGNLGVGFNQMVEKSEQTIIEIKQAQEELVRQEKLALVGRLSGSIAHEIRNPLGVIGSSVFYLKTKLKGADAKTLSHRDRIHNQVKISTNIIQNLQNLSVSKEGRKVRLDLTDVVEDGVTLARPPRRVGVVNEVLQGNIFVDADREQLAIVFKNLATNAVQAMDSEGTIGVTAENTADGWCEVFFRDSGHGIEADNLERIFEPLFITGTRGMGFGLAICRMIIERRGGTIEAQSEAGKGATFIVRLPSCENHKGG